jgi:hypothetical protein
MGVQSKVFGCPPKGFLTSFFNQWISKDFTAILGDEDEVIVASPNIVARRSQFLIASANTTHQTSTPAASSTKLPLRGGAPQFKVCPQEEKCLF